MIIKLKSNKQTKKATRGKNKGETITIRAKKTEKEYKNELKALRRFSFGFEGIDARKRLSSGQKAKITKAVNQIASKAENITDAGFIPIKRKKGEREKAYKNRVRKITEGYGQEIGVRGVFVENYDPKTKNYRMNQKGEITMVDKDSGLKEDFLPMDAAAYAEKGMEYFKEVFLRLKTKNPKAETIFAISFDKRQDVMRMPVFGFGEVVNREQAEEYLDKRARAYLPDKAFYTDGDIFAAMVEWFINMYLTYITVGGAKRDYSYHLGGFVSEEQ